MIRTQIQLTNEQLRRLRKAARGHGVSVAEMIRRLIDQGIEVESAGLAARYAGAQGIIGAFRDREGAGDVAVRHDDYLGHAYQ